MTQRPSTTPRHTPTPGTPTSGGSARRPTRRPAARRLLTVTAVAAAAALTLAGCGEAPEEGGESKTGTGSESGSEKAVDTDMAWLAHISDWQAETADPGEFLDSLRFEIGAKEVYVFTPKGRVIGLPAGGTPVDFAYAVHTEVGHRTMGAKVNGRLVPLESELQSGDAVEIFT